MVWTQWWVVESPDEAAAQAHVLAALQRWAPPDTEWQLPAIRFYRGPDDLALSEAFAQDMALIQQTVLTSHRQELARRLHILGYRGLGIPPKPGWVILDHSGPRSPRPHDWSRPHGPRWIVTVQWAGEPPTLSSP